MTKWVVEAGENNVVFTQSELFEFLLGQLDRKDDRSCDLLVTNYLSLLGRDTSSLGHMSLGNLLLVAFRLGYYYSLFLRKNKVTIQESE